MDQPSILIADNDRSVGLLLTEVLGRLGCHAALVQDGEQAVAALARQQFRVLVCDLDMPRLTGLEVIEWLARRPSPPAVVVVSGYLDAVAGQQLSRQPFIRSVLRKPFDVIAFGQLVAGLVAERRGSGAAEAS